MWYYQLATDLVIASNLNPHPWLDGIGGIARVTDFSAIKEYPVVSPIVGITCGFLYRLHKGGASRNFHKLVTTCLYQDSLTPSG